MRIFKLIIYLLLLAGSFIVTMEYGGSSGEEFSYVSFSSLLSIFYFGYKILKLLADWTTDFDLEDDYRKKHRGYRSYNHSRYQPPHDYYINTTNIEPHSSCADKKEAIIESVSKLKILRNDIKIQQDD